MDEMRTHAPETELTQDMVKAMDWVPAMVWVAGRDAQCRHVNSAWREVTGRSLEECLGSGWLAAMHPDDAAAWPEQISQAIKTLQPFSLECRLRRKDGRYRWFMKTGRPYFSDKGEMLGFIGYCTDVTSQKHALDSLRQAKEKHRSVLNNLKEAVSTIEDVLRTDEPGHGIRGDYRLTPRQREILHLIARGYATREIAVQLHVSVKTVESHRAQLMQRLNIHDVASLTRFAIRNGIVPPDC
jgi:PAS domain S-box-containing protein